MVAQATAYVDPERLDARWVKQLAPYVEDVFERPGPVDSVDKGLHTVAEDLLGEDRGTRDRDSLAQVPLDDAATSGALGADGDAARPEDHGKQVGQRGGEVEDELLGATRDPEPGSITGQPQGDVGTTGNGGGCDGECLIGTLGILGAAGDLDDELAGHVHTLE